MVRSDAGIESRFAVCEVAPTGGTFVFCPLCGGFMAWDWRGVEVLSCYRCALVAVLVDAEKVEEAA